MTSLVLTVIGADRPGLVEALSETIADHSANWLESRMTRLQGRFAGLLRVSVPDAYVRDLVAALQQLEERELGIIVQSSEPIQTVVESRTLQLELVGHDHPGIVRYVSHVLAERDVNVEELETSVSSAPMSGEALFRAKACLRAPADVSLDELRETLEKIANELMVDLSLDERD